ncbi:WhiB family transcriptional regulator [Streptomyces sp. NPDC059534]|uniref:WhiB family transcriptional regulator n=1 Tax=Streptomyces sp. NPDC059534 TaxID=3346859 RepID=UPI0036797A3F
MSETRGVSTAQSINWRALAACQAVDPDAMFPDPGDKAGTAYAKDVCNRCPVVQSCLDDAMAAEGGKRQDNRYGVQGSLTPAQRYHLHHRYRMRDRASAV